MSSSLGSAAMPITLDQCDEQGIQVGGLEQHGLNFSTANIEESKVLGDKVYENCDSVQVINLVVNNNTNVIDNFTNNIVINRIRTKILKKNNKTNHFHDQTLNYLQNNVNMVKKCEKPNFKTKNLSVFNVNESQTLLKNFKTADLPANSSKKKDKKVKIKLNKQNEPNQYDDTLAYNIYPECVLEQGDTIDRTQTILLNWGENDKSIDMYKKLGTNKVPVFYNDKILEGRVLPDNGCSLGLQFKSNDLMRKVVGKNKLFKNNLFNVFKCTKCLYLTITEDNLEIHYSTRHKNTSVITPQMLSCVGCKNEFATKTSLRIHLLHDHQVATNELKIIMKNIDSAQNVRSKNRSCIFDEANNEHQLLDDLQHGLSTDYEDSTYNGLSSCINNQKQPTMLETYLDLNEKHSCQLPPTLSQNGADILENTFNFTAPVSEQLPEIQPQSETPTSNMVEDHSENNSHHSTSSHGYLSLASVYPDPHEQSEYKSSIQHHFDIVRNNQTTGSTSYNMLPDTYSSQLDIPVIDIDDNSMLKTNDNSVMKTNPDDPASLLSVIHIDDKTTTRNDMLDMFKTGLHQHNYDYNNMYMNGTGQEVNVDGGQPGGVVGGSAEEKESEEEKRKMKKLGFGYRCDINGCKVRLQSEENIRYHRRCHEGTLYNCPECYKDCPTWISLSSHLWQAHLIDMDLYTCDQCSYKTPSYSRLTNIHRGIHGTVRPFLCEVCGRKFKTVKQMRNHKNTHKAKMVRIPVFHCGICGRNVSDKRQLQIHINNVHKKKKPFSCPTCSYKTGVKNSLIVHMRRHTGDKPYSCDKCEFKTADHNSLRRHKMKHTGVKNYKCSHCDYSSIQSSTFKAHLKTKHPGLTTEMVFSCSECSFQTLKSGMLMTHMAEHDRGVRKNSRYYNFDPTAAGTQPAAGIRPTAQHVINETGNIVDLSHHDLLEDTYYERITGDLEEPLESQELKFKNTGVT